MTGQVVSPPSAYADHRSVNCLDAYTAAVQSGVPVNEANNCPIELVNADPARFTQADKDAGHHPSLCNPDPSLCIALGIAGAVVVVAGAIVIGAILLGLADDGPDLGGGGTITPPTPTTTFALTPIICEPLGGCHGAAPIGVTFDSGATIGFSTVYTAVDGISPPGATTVGNLQGLTWYIGSNCTFVPIPFQSNATVTCT